MLAHGKNQKQVGYQELAVAFGRLNRELEPAGSKARYDKKPCPLCNGKSSPDCPGCLGSGWYEADYGRSSDRTRMEVALRQAGPN
jgi:hypothetical protein